MLVYFRNSKKFCLALCTTLLMFTLSGKAAGILDIKDRPAGLRDAIDKKYKDLASSDVKGWSYNGAEKYLVLSLDDNAVVKKIVDTFPSQEVFNLMDVGAGDHRWAHARVKFLNEEYFGRDVHFNIFSLTGDNYKEDGYQERAGVNIVEQHEGVCSLYKLSAFPVENLIAKLTELGYFAMLDKQIDFSVAAYTLMHLVDPVGTFLQMYNLARPNQGLIFVENFFRMSGHDNAPVDDFLKRAQLEFFKRHNGNSFVVRRSDEEGAQLPFTYQLAEYDKHPRAQLVNVESEEGIKRNPKNNLKGILKDNGSESLRDWLPFKK